MPNIPAHLISILDEARWAPSGDNTQPWRFEIVSNEHLIVHGFDTRNSVVYDLDGHASQLAVGALLETIQIAATHVGRKTMISRRQGTPDTHLKIDVHMESCDGLVADPLYPYIEKRVVQRRPMSIHPLADRQKSKLAASLPADFKVFWFEGFSERLKLASIAFDSAKIRLTTPEAYAVHKSIIEWGSRFSADRIPEEAVGVDPLTARFMHWALADWRRIDFINTWLFGHIPPRLQLDFIPGLACGAHFALFAPAPLTTVANYLESGQAMQRFWLTATSQGLFVQPEMTPLIFARYSRHGVHFSKTIQSERLAENINQRLIQLFKPNDIEGLFFLGRIGHGSAPKSRSVRKPLEQLVWDKQSDLNL